MLFFIILVIEDFPLFLTDLLQNDILGILCGNAPEFLGLDLHIHDIAHFILGITHLGVRQANLKDRIFHVFHNFLLRIDGKITGFRVNVYFYIIRFSEMIFTGLQK